MSGEPREEACRYEESFEPCLLSVKYSLVSNRRSPSPAYQLLENFPPRTYLFNPPPLINSGNDFQRRQKQHNKILWAQNFSIDRIEFPMCTKYPTLLRITCTNTKIYHVHEPDVVNEDERNIFDMLEDM